MRATSGGQTNVESGARRVWVIWVVAVLAYGFAVTQRTSFGAAGLAAGERFGVTPGVLSLFVFLQIGVYALGQVPAGLLVDRRGSRVVMVAGGVLLGGGQLLMAFAGSLPLAALARVLVGGGDALVFAATLALLPRWFPASRVPFLTQITTIVGQFGQVVSAIPLLAMLAGVGWTPAFALMGGASLVVAGLSALLVRDAPAGVVVRGPRIPPRALLRQVAAVWARPGTRLGFFGHMGTQFSMMAFSLLWGVPYLVSAQGLAPLTAGWLLTLMVLTTVVVGPVVGLFCGRHPMRRSLLVLVIIGLHVLLWTVVLLVPGPAPLWLLVVLVVALAIGGPGSAVGFDIARTTNPASSLAVAQGMVNVGGFGATLFTLAAMGAVLTAGGGFTPEAFRVAWLVQYAVWALAVVGIVRTRRTLRRLEIARGNPVPRPLREVVRSRRSGGPALRCAPHTMARRSVPTGGSGAGMSGWFTSSYSDPERSWVQVRFDGEQVLVADSKDRGAGPVITVDGRAWDEFVVAALSGEPEPTDALRSAPLPDRGRTVVASDGTTLYFTRAEWDAFIAGAAEGEFRRTAVV